MKNWENKVTRLEKRPVGPRWKMWVELFALYFCNLYQENFLLQSVKCRKQGCGVGVVLGY